MAGYLVRKEKSFTKKLLMAAMIMVRAIKNSVYCCGILIILKVLRASVMEWPNVNAVTRMMIFFQSWGRYLRHSAVIKRI